MATIRGREGNFAVATGQASHILTNIVANSRPFTTNFNFQNVAQDITGLNATPPAFMLNRAEGLASWDASFTAYYPDTPAGGHQGLVTFANGYTVGINRFTLDLTNGAALDDTAFASTPPTWRSFQPGGMWGGTGTYRARADTSTPITFEDSGSATFRLCNVAPPGVANTLTGAIAITGVSSAIVIGDQVFYDYSFVFTGVIASAGADALFPTGDLGEPEITSIEITLDNDEIAGDCFLTDLSVTVEVGSLIEINATLQGTGALVVTP